LFLGPPFRIGSRPQGKKSRAAVDTDYLERALAHFSGYLAADELYDGPFCVLSLVDNRAFNRLSFRVLEHDPTQNDIRRFLGDFKARLDERGLTVRGITTDGSELYPKPLHELWPDAPHQVCEFHVLKEITKAVLHALATTRKELRDRIPKQPRGRPPKAERAQSRKAARQQEQVSKLFEHRYLFVRHRLTADQKRTLQRITRGLAHLRRLRQIMEEVYRLFDRRCRTETALARLAQLRRCVSRFKWLGRALNNLSSPNLEKALTFLDDKLLPTTSNAVERSNRRYRKAQRSIYSVRTAEHIGQRIALDMQREQQAPDRAETTKALHQARSETEKLQH
jgi:Transposase